MNLIANMRSVYLIAIVLIAHLILSAQAAVSHGGRFVHQASKAQAAVPQPASSYRPLAQSAFSPAHGGANQFRGCQESGLQRLADWIARYQGFAWNREGDLIRPDMIHSRSSRDHNPGNLRVPGYRKDEQGYSIFPSAAAGWKRFDAYLKNYIKRFGRQSLRNFIDGEGNVWRGYRRADADDPQHSFLRFLALSMNLSEDTPMLQIARGGTKRSPSTRIAHQAARQPACSASSIRPFTGLERHPPLRP